MPSKAGLARDERIRGQFEYREVIRKGRLITGTRFKGYFLIGTGRVRKVGFVAGRHVGNACLRNRAKRLLRESYRTLKAGCATRGFRAVFVATHATPAATFAEIRNEMAWMLERCGLVGGG